MRKKLVYIILTEVTSAIFYFFWAAPALTAKHMDIETLIPVLIVSLSSLALLLIILLSRMQRKSYPFETTVLITMVIWGVALFVVGTSAQCPVCSYSMV